MKLNRNPGMNIKVTTPSNAYKNLLIGHGPIQPITENKINTLITPIDPLTTFAFLVIIKEQISKPANLTV